MSDATAVRLFHPMWPDGREFDPVVAKTMRLQGWTDKPGTAEPEAEPDKADSPTKSTTGPGRTNTGGPRG